MSPKSFINTFALRSIACAAGVAALAVSHGANGRILDGEIVTVDQPIADTYMLINASTLNVTSTGSTQDIRAYDGSTVNINGGSVSATAGNTGVSLTTGSKATLNNATITSLSSFGVGLAQASEMQVTNGTITGRDGATVAGFSRLDLAGATVTGTGAGAPTGTGTGVFVLGSTLVASQGTTMTGSTNGVHIRQGTVAQGAGDSSVTINDSTVRGVSGSAILVRNAVGVVGGNANILVENNSKLLSGNGTILEVNGGMTANFTVDGSALDGNVVVDSTSVGNVTLRNSSVLNGNLVNVANLAVNSNARWNMTESAQVGALSMNGGTVDLGGGAASVNTLTLGSLAGTGTFIMGVDLLSHTGNFLNVTGQAEGDYQLDIRNTGLDPAKGEDQLQVVHTGSGDAQFKLLGGELDYGTFAYGLEKAENGQDWYLVQRFDDDGNPIVTPGARTVLGLFSAAPSVWYGELTTLISRMGELRLGNGEGGSWIRAYGNRYNLSAGSGVAYQQNQSGLSFGVDAPIPGRSDQWLVGLMGGFSQSDLDFQAGSSGQVKSYYVGAYSTWLAESGYYVDTVLKLNRFNNQADVTMSDGSKADGSYNNSGLGGSVEFGKHIKLNDDWYVAPFTQASALWVGGDGYSLDNGMYAQSNRTNSLLGKVGTQVGRTVALEGGGTLQPYLKVAAAHEFVNTNRVEVNDNRFTNDLSGTRGEVGLGLIAQVSDNLQLHGDFEYSNGKHIEQPLGVNLGLRYNF